MKGGALCHVGEEACKEVAAQVCRFCDLLLICPSWG